MLRHTCGTLLYKDTKDLQIVKQVLRHSNVNITSKYAHIYNKMDKRYTTGINLNENINNEDKKRHTNKCVPFFIFINLLLIYLPNNLFKRPCSLNSVLKNLVALSNRIITLSPTTSASNSGGSDSAMRIGVILPTEDKLLSSKIN